MKRLFDICCALLGLLLLSPLFLLIAIAIKVSDRGPVFFLQERIGRRGKPFRIWKFRTMVTRADKMGIPLTVGHDPRITRIGSLLRKSKLDELPQLINILKGEMSFVGPRPEVAKYVEGYTPEQRRVLELVPGLTDVASVTYRNESEVLAQAQDPEDYYREELVPAKIELNLSYAEQASVYSDILVILSTLTTLTGLIPKASTTPKPS